MQSYRLRSVAQEAQLPGSGECPFAHNVFTTAVGLTTALGSPLGHRPVLIPTDIVHLHAIRLREGLVVGAKALYGASVEFACPGLAPMRHLMASQRCADMISSA